MFGVFFYICVFDLFCVLVGFWVGQIFVDFGVEVIKIECFGSGDDICVWGLLFFKDVEGNDISEVVYYLLVNCNKKLVMVDFIQLEGQCIVCELVVKVDILLENFKVGGFKVYGFDYELLKQVNLKLIYCLIIGFGQFGFYVKCVGYDFMIQGLGGLMSFIGCVDNEEGVGLVKVGVVLIDIFIGLYFFIVVFVVFVYCDVSGIGQYIDMVLFDVQVVCLVNQIFNYLIIGVLLWCLGNVYLNIVLYQDFFIVDGDMIFMVGNDSQFCKFVELVDYLEWVDDLCFVINKVWVVNCEVLILLICQVMVLYIIVEWIFFLECVGVFCGLINDLVQVFVDLQVQVCGLCVELLYLLVGMVLQVVSLICLFEMLVEYCNLLFIFGQYIDEVFEMFFGLDVVVLERLCDGKVI